MLTTLPKPITIVFCPLCQDVKEVWGSKDEQFCSGCFMDIPVEQKK